MAIVQALSLLIHNFFFVMTGIIGIGFLIGFHELGHFIFCKIFKIRTPSFSIGFGPQLISKKIGDTTFALSAIPLGGYVEIAGAIEPGQGEQHYAHAEDEHSFAVKPYYQKMLVMAGGIFFNLIFAYCALILLFALGIPQTPLLYPQNATTIIKAIQPESPAETAGLQSGDTIIAIDHQAVSALELLKKIQSLPGQTVSFSIERQQQALEVPVTVGIREIGAQKIGFIGTEFELQEIPARPFGEAIREGIATTNRVVVETFGIFKRLFASKSTNGLGGPLMVITQTIKGAQKGFKVFLLLLAIISINLAVLNVLPLPILDGGQAVLYTIEALAGRELPAKMREYIAYACWFIVLGLVVFLTIKDLRFIIGF